MAGGPSLGERPLTDRKRAAGRPTPEGGPGPDSNHTPARPAHSPGAHRREPAQTRDCGGGPVNNTPPPPASRNLEGETPHFRERGRGVGRTKCSFSGPHGEPSSVPGAVVPAPCLGFVPTVRAGGAVGGRGGTGQPGVADAPLFVITDGIAPAAGWPLPSGGLGRSEWPGGGASWGPCPWEWGAGRG